MAATGVAFAADVEWKATVRPAFAGSAFVLAAAICASLSRTGQPRVPCAAQPQPLSWVAMGDGMGRDGKGQSSSRGSWLRESALAPRTGDATDCCRGPRSEGPEGGGIMPRKGQHKLAHTLQRMGYVGSEVRKGQHRRRGNRRATHARMAVLGEPLSTCGCSAVQLRHRNAHRSSLPSGPSARCVQG